MTVIGVKIIVGARFIAPGMALVISSTSWGETIPLPPLRGEEDNIRAKSGSFWLLASVSLLFDPLNTLILYKI